MELNGEPEGSRPTRFHRASPLVSRARLSMNTFVIDCAENGASAQPVVKISPSFVASASANAFGSASARAGI